jgi:hypothetical protein
LTFGDSTSEMLTVSLQYPPPHLGSPRGSPFSPQIQPFVVVKVRPKQGLVEAVSTNGIEVAVDVGDSYVASVLPVLPDSISDTRIVFF